MDTSTNSSSSTARLPDWLAEALDVLSARSRVVVATAVGIVLLGGIVAVLAPSILPPRAIVGAAVGIAAALLATAVALAMDASDLVVRGSRHVRAAGGGIDVRVGRQHDDVGPLLAAVARHATDGHVRVALSSASRTAGVPGVRAAALAEALARTGRKVLLTDLTRSGTPAAGLSDVITGSRTLAEVVRFEQELYLARLAVGSDPDAALRGFPDWVDALPSDLEVLVVALPPLAEKGVLPAAGAMDCTLVLVEVDRTERVDLIASLDAVDASGVTSELVLVDPARSPAPAAVPPEEQVEAFDEVADEPLDEPADHPILQEEPGDDGDAAATELEDEPDDELVDAEPPYEYEVSDEQAPAIAADPEPTPERGGDIRPRRHRRDRSPAPRHRDAGRRPASVHRAGAAGGRRPRAGTGARAGTGVRARAGTGARTGARTGACRRDPPRADAGLGTATGLGAAARIHAGCPAAAGPRRTRGRAHVGGPAPARPADLGPGRRVTARRLLAVLAGLLLLLPACSSEVPPGGTLEWRELTVDLPADWVELDRTDTSLSVGDGPGSTTPGERGDLYVFTQFTIEPDTTADDWRRFVEEQDATLERDTTTTVGGLPAELIQYSFTTNRIPTRERIVVVPSRDLVLLQQPVPMQGDTEAPDWFDEHLDEFDALLDGISFGAPADYLDR